MSVPVRPLRRKDRLMAEEGCLRLLEKAEFCVLATSGENGFPYAVPLSFVFLDGKLYFHCATKGHKIDNLRANPSVCVTVVGDVEPVFDNGFSTYYESVIVFGRAEEVTEPEAMRTALTALAEKYLPGRPDKIESEIARYGKATAVYAVIPETISGKAKTAHKDS